MIKTLLIGRMDVMSRMAIPVQMLSFRNKMQKPRAITYWTILQTEIRLFTYISIVFFLSDAFRLGGIGICLNKRKPINS